MSLIHREQLSLVTSEKKQKKICLKINIINCIIRTYLLFFDWKKGVYHVVYLLHSSDHCTMRSEDFVTAQKHEIDKIDINLAITLQKMLLLPCMSHAIMDNFQNRLTFNLGQTNEIFYYS